MGLDYGDIIRLTRNKKYVFEKFIGKGGTGRTALLRDDIININLVCKKYEPDAGNDKNDCFLRFIEEIKILYKIYHKNVVRIYNYFCIFKRECKIVCVNFRR